MNARNFSKELKELFKKYSIRSMDKTTIVVSDKKSCDTYNLEIFYKGCDTTNLTLRLEKEKRALD
jgi:hypothetical protein